MSKISLFVATFAMVAGGFFCLLAVPAYAVDEEVTTDVTPLGTEDLGLSYGAATGLSSTDVRTTVARIIRVAMGLLGIVAVVIILIGGFKWMTAGGNEEQVGEAKKWIFSGVIGLVIILSAYALASFIITQLTLATGTP
ncbi:MAG: pilin [Patescibacteria group bacterium]|nr:pilin [Patescibacteria group bacterium]